MVAFRSPRLAPVVCALAALSCITPVAAAPISATGLFNLVDNVSANSVGRVSGLRNLFGALDVTPNGASGTTATATQGGRTVPVPWLGLSTQPNEFSQATAYSPSLTGNWTLNFRNGGDTLTVNTPAIGSVAVMPFVQNVSLSGSATAPTVSWTVPTGANADSAFVRLWDLGQRAVGSPGLANAVHRFDLAPTTTSYTLPQTFSTGQQLVLGRQYAIEVALNDLRPGGGTQSRSVSYFEFTPTAGGLPPGTFLPTVDPTAGPTGGPVFQFSVTNVGGRRIFIDPELAVGYDYAKGSGDPNFSSVLLPTGIGDDLYTLVLPDGTRLLVNGGVPFSFATGGVDRFRVEGIELSAGLDPFDVTAFPTGLTFVSDGNFTGTMTPIIATLVNAVPLPGTWALLGVGACAFGVGRRRARRPPTALTAARGYHRRQTCCLPRPDPAVVHAAPDS